MLCVASLSPIKNPSILIHAFKFVVDSIHPIKLHLVGDGPLRPQLEILTQTLKLQKFVIFHGKLPHPELVDFYSAADLLVMSSIFESQGMVVLEAGACGLPTVGTSVGILPELGTAVRTIPAQTASTLARAIIDLLQDPTGRSEIAQAILNLVHSRFSIQNTVKSSSDLYSKIS